MNCYFVDTHAHLFMESFDQDRGQVLQRAMDKGVSKIVLPNVDLLTIPLLKKTVAMAPDRLFPLMGLHPSSVKDDFEQVLASMEQELERDKYWGMGEIGIDLYWPENKSFREQQIEAFRYQLRMAKARHIPVVIHTRDSFDLTYQVVKEEKEDSLRGIFHCFTGSYEQAKNVMDLGGFYMGIGGVLTFKNSKLGERIKDVPLDYLVLETDAPFLTPHPYRGKRNESSYIPLIAQKLAEVKGVGLEEVACKTTENAEKLFGI